MQEWKTGTAQIAQLLPCLNWISVFVCLKEIDIYIRKCQLLSGIRKYTVQKTVANSTIRADWEHDYILIHSSSYCVHHWKKWVWVWVGLRPIDLIISKGCSMAPNPSESALLASLQAGLFHWKTFSRAAITQPEIMSSCMFWAFLQY